MLDRQQQFTIETSLTTRIAVHLGFIVLLAVGAIISSIAVTVQLEYHAAAINLAGSMRMQSYLIATAFSEHRNSDKEEHDMLVKAAIHTQLNKLNDPIFVALEGSMANRLFEHHQQLLTQWEPWIQAARMESSILPLAEKYLQEVVERVQQIDQWVFELQKDEERKILHLRIVQILCLTLIAVASMILIFRFKREVVEPLKTLTVAAKKARQRDFSTRLDIQTKDELFILAQAFNTMCEDLEKRYQDLEAQINLATDEIRQRNKSLQFLYSLYRKLTEQLVAPIDSESLVKELAETVKNGTFTLCLNPIPNLLDNPMREKSHDPVAADQAHPTCTQCHQLSLAVIEPSAYVREFPIRHQKEFFGRLFVRLAEGTTLEEHDVGLIDAICDAIASALFIRRQNQQQNRVALMEERAVIARELHDSIAQALSYLKIQVTRMKKVEPERSAALNEVIQEFSDGLNGAYRQLRELLTTFRLKPEDEGFIATLQKTVREFSQRGQIPIHLDMRILPRTMSPNEELHILQIAREALANIIHHAQATEAWINFESLPQNDEILMQIIDNGIGIPDSQDKANHYGMIIMRERAAILGGQIHVSKIEPHGTAINLTFKPKAIGENVGT